MAQSKEFVDASHEINTLSHALALLESRNASLQGAVEGTSDENDKLRELLREMWTFTELVNVSGRLSNGGAWSAAEFEKRMKEPGVIE